MNKYALKSNEVSPLRQRIVEAIREINARTHKSAKYEDVLNHGVITPPLKTNYSARTIEREMRKMAQEGLLIRSEAGGEYYTRDMKRMQSLGRWF